MVSLLAGWRWVEGYKYPSPIIESLGAFCSVQGTRPKPGLEPSWPACRGWEGLQRGRPELGLGWPWAGRVAEAAGLEPAWPRPGGDAGGRGGARSRWPGAGLDPAWSWLEAGKVAEPPGLGPAWPARQCPNKVTFSFLLKTKFRHM